MAALHVLDARAAVGVDYRPAHHRAADGAGHDRAVAARDLVAQDAAEDAADHRAAHLVAVVAHLGLLDPAVLRRRAEHRMRCDHLRLEQLFLRTRTRVIGRRGHRRPAAVGHGRARRHHAHRRDAVVHAHRAQAGVVAGAQEHAVAVEAGVVADLPALAHDHRRRRAVVEARAAQVADVRRRAERAAAEAVALVERDLARQRRRRPLAVGDRAVAACLAGRRDAVVEAHRAQRRIVAGTQHEAVAAEARVVADLPGAAGDHHRRGAVVEADALEVVDRVAHGDLAPRVVVVLVEGDVRERHAGAGEGDGAQRGLEDHGVHSDHSVVV